MNTEQEKFNSREIYASEIHQRLQIAYNIAAANMLEKARYRAETNQQIPPSIEYQPGDLVRIFLPALPTGKKAKLAKRWVGPYVIDKRTDINNYMIHKMNEESPKSFIIHTQRIKPYLRIQDRTRDIPPTSDNNNMVSL